MGSAVFMTFYTLLFCAFGFFGGEEVLEPLPGKLQPRAKGDGPPSNKSQRIKHTTRTRDPVRLEGWVVGSSGAVTLVCKSRQI